jgi:hypothetical protein
VSESNEVRCYKNVLRCNEQFTVLNSNRKSVIKKCGNIIAKKVIYNLVVFWCFLKLLHQDFIANELDNSSSAVVHWCNYVRKVCTFEVMQKKKKLGGNGKTVQIDEAKIGN